MKKESEIPFYVIISKSKEGKEFAWGGSNNLKKTERILINPCGRFTPVGYGMRP